MKILFLADLVFEDHPGGSRMVARELAGGLVARGHDVTFLVRAKNGEASSETEFEGSHVIRFAAPPDSALGYVKAGQDACTQLLETNTYDIVHTHFAYSACGPLKAVPGDVPHVRSFYGPWHDEGLVEDRNALSSAPQVGRRRTVRFAATCAAMYARYAVRNLVERQNLGRSKVTIVLSEQSRREALALNCPARSIVKIGGGVDVERFVPAADKAAVRRSLGLPDNGPLLLSIRRLAPRMGLDNLIKAMPAIVARHPNALLLIGGQGTERAKLDALIAELDLTENVRMLGFIPEETLVSHYQCADAFVLPTVALEGFGLVTTESLSCGVPVIGTDIGATPELLSPLDSRLLVSHSTPDALAAAILDFLDGQWACRLTPALLRRHVLDNYRWDLHVDAVERIYNDLLLANAPSRTLEATLPIRS